MHTRKQFAVNFKGCKIDGFLDEKNDICLIFAENIDCGYT